jgi:hypothetical protein
MFEQNQAHQQWLERFIAGLDAFAGTVHVQRGDDLYLTAAHNIPPNVVQIVAHVPHGKGMAGVAQVKKAPVQTCNLQTDASGTIKPGAKAVDADGNVRAVVGVAWRREGEIGAEQEQAMLKAAAQLP